jgi:hypothetical protein
VRPFFPRLVEPVAQRLVWLDEQGIDVQIVGKRASAPSSLSWSGLRSFATFAALNASPVCVPTSILLGANKTIE